MRHKLVLFTSSLLLLLCVLQAPSGDATGGPNPAVGYLTITSETGVFHSVCLLEYPNGTKKWFGFKPAVHLSPSGPGFVETANRESYINHYIRFQVAVSSLTAAESMIAAKYAHAQYEVLVFDCVSMTADVARVCGLNVDDNAYTPFGLITFLRFTNQYVNYDDEPYPWD